MSAPTTRGGWSFWSLSVLLHLVLVIVALAAWFMKPDQPAPEQRLAIEAIVVASRPARAPARPAPEPAPEPAPLSEPMPAAPQVDVERAAEAERVAEARRVAEERLAAERKDAEAAQRRKAEQDAREKAAREKVARDKAEQERKQRETDLNAQIAAEERLAAARASGMMAQYIAQITARIERAWIRPPGASAGLQCEVRVTQVPGGAVTGVQVGRCNGDESVRQSIEAAVYRASPLPQPADATLFERNLMVTFRPEN